MRLKAYPVVLLLFFSGLLRAQTYQSFRDSNAVWNIAYGYTLGNRSYTVMGDSLYNSKLYKRYYSASTLSITTPQYVFFGLLREDTVTKEVYAIKAGSNQEKLLYKFNLAINSIITIFPQDFGYESMSFNLKLTARDSILVNGQYRKRMKMTSYGWGYLTEYWIEGIGSTYGLFTPGLSAYPIADAEVCKELRCYWENGNMVYSPFPLPICNGPKINCATDLKELENSTQVLCFPNPAKEQFILSSEMDLNAELSIYDLLGQRFISQDIKGKQQTEISLHGLKNGIYLIELRDKKNAALIHKQKLFVQEE